MDQKRVDELMLRVGNLLYEIGRIGDHIEDELPYPLGYHTASIFDCVDEALIHYHQRRENDE